MFTASVACHLFTQTWQTRNISFSGGGEALNRKEDVINWYVQKFDDDAEDTSMEELTEKTILITKILNRMTNKDNSVFELHDPDNSDNPQLFVSPNYVRE